MLRLRFGIQTDCKNLSNDDERYWDLVEELMKFLRLVIYTGFKPVMWSVVEQTALAEAEIGTTKNFKIHIC